MTVDGSLRLARNFRLREFRCDDGRLPPHRALPALRQLVTGSLQPLRTRFGVVTVTSAWRSSAHNSQVGGAAMSYHLWELRDFTQLGVDVICESGTPGAWADFLEECGTRGVGLYDDHVHADNRRGPQVHWRG